MSSTSRPRIAYYSLKDPRDKRSWSGIIYYLGESLQRHIGDVDFLGPVKIPWILDIFMRSIQRFSKLVFGKIWAPNFSLVKNIYAGQCLKRRMKDGRYDFLVAPAAAELAYLKTNIPIIYFGDATFKIYTECYDEFSSLSSFSKWEGNHLEQKALQKSDVVIMASNWAAQSAINHYGIPASKVEVVVMGANMDSVPDKSIIYKKEDNPNLTLLFLGVDWERKGGPIAFDTLEQLQQMGVDAQLIVCGVIPPEQFKNPGMKVIPFLNKNDAEDYNQFCSLLASAHFLIMPTRADCSLLVNNEANAYGVPTITTDVGGVSDVVKDGVNGYCLPFAAKGAEYASLISSIFSDKERYNQLIQSSRERFDTVLNWGNFAHQLKGILQRHQVYKQ